MPQLDTLTFFSQFFWLSIFYLGFYLALVKYFLPKMGRILKIRSLKMSSGSTGSGPLLEMKEEHELLKQKRDNSLLEGLKESRQLFQESSQNTQVWLQKVLDDINKNQLQEVNKNYFQSVSDLSIAQALVLNNLKTVLAPSSNKSTGGFAFISNDPSKEKFFTSKMLESLSR